MAVFGASLLFLIPGMVAHAQSNTNCRPLAYSSSNAQGFVESLELACDFEGTGTFEDRITVLDEDGSMRPLDDWQRAVDWTDDVWFFDYRGDKRVELIVDFSNEAGSLKAELYDIRKGEDRIGYTIDGRQFTPAPSTIPRVTMQAKDGWWKHNGRVNYNLDLVIDGYVYATHDANRIETFLKLDRKPDISIQIRDRDNDGHAEQDWRTIIFDQKQIPESYRIPNTFLVINERDDEAPIADIFPLPYLGNVSFAYEISSPHTVTPPPIQIDWSSASIAYIGEFVSSRGNDAQWFLYSYIRAEMNQTTPTNFETPFGWYDIADDRDHTPELAIRSIYYPSNDPLVVNGRISRPINNIRYSWDQNNDGKWDYKLGLLGNHIIDSVVAFPEFSLQTISYSDLPDWVVDRSWGVGIFVSADSIKAQGEGIYEWDAPAWLAEGYFAGRTTDPKPPTADEPLTTANTRFQTILPGYRGEYRIDFNQRVRLYFSPIDRKLHLFGAERGMWNIDGRQMIYYADSDGDGYFDRWQVRNGDSVIEQLDVTATHLVYTTERGTTIKAIQPIHPLFETDPPTDNLTWLTLSQQIKRGVGDGIPPTIEAMVSSIAGEQWQIEDAQVTQFRPTVRGFRFVLDVLDGQTIKRSPFGSEVHPGRYVITYDGAWHIAQIGPTTIQAAISTSVLEQLQQSTLSVHLTNEGLQDISQATLDIIATSPLGDSATVISTTVELLSGVPVTTVLHWSPPLAGSWTLTPKLRTANNEVYDFAPMKFTVQPVADTGSLVIVGATIDKRLLSLVGLCLALFSFTAGIVFWRTLSR